MDSPDHLPRSPVPPVPGAGRESLRWQADSEDVAPGVTLVRVAGTIGGRTAAALEKRLSVVVRSRPVRPSLVQLDLSGVVFLDRAGLDVLLRLQAFLGMTSGELELLSPSPAVVRLLHEAHLDDASWMWPGG